jgi:hypothetical protein
MKRVGKQTNAACPARDKTVVNAEPAVATNIVNLLIIKKYEEMLTSRSQLLNTLGRG